MPSPHAYLAVRGAITLQTLARYYNDSAPSKVLQNFYLSAIECTPPSPNPADNRLPRGQESE
jgi:hypothetical protein